MAVAMSSTSVLQSGNALKQMLSNPWSYFPNMIGGDLVGIVQVGPSRFLVAFGKTWTSGVASQTDPPTFSSPVSGGPRLFDVDTSARQAHEITSGLLLSPHASLRAVSPAGTGMHIVVSTSTGTHAQFIQNFSNQTLRALDPKPLTPSFRANGEGRLVEWDRGAANYSHGFFAVGADSDNQLYVSQVRTPLTAAGGYDPSMRSYLSDKGWTRRSTEQTPLRRVGGMPLLSSVPVGLTYMTRGQAWFILIPHQVGGTWGWELLKASSLLSPFRHVSYVPGVSAVPVAARFHPGLVLETDPTMPPGVAWSYSPEAGGTFYPRLDQLVEE